jgi:hypothetical protein
MMTTETSSASNESSFLGSGPWATAVPLLLFLLIIFLSPLLFDLTQALS